MEKIKAIGMLQQSSILIFGIVMSLLVLIIALSGLYPSAWYLWMILGVLSITSLDLGLWWAKAKFKKSPEYRKIGVWRSIVSTYQSFNILVSIMILLGFLLCLMALLIALLFVLILIPIKFSESILYLFLGYLLYLPIRLVIKPPGKKIFGLIPKSIMMLPDYVLVDDGLIINFNIKTWKQPKKQWTAKIKFNELDEIKEFSPQEAMVYMGAVISPDVALFAKTLSNFRKFTKGEINRPAVYVTRNTSPFPGWQVYAGKTVLLKGPSLFYFVTFTRRDVSDLIQRFKSYKRKA